MVARRPHPQIVSSRVSFLRSMPGLQSALPPTTLVNSSFVIHLSHGFQGDLSYTLGNSIDVGSDAERSSEKQGGSGSYITNAWNPAQSRGVSDFDTRHLITANGSYLLPFGRGQAFGTHVNRLTDLVIGGWQRRFHRSLDERPALLPDRRWLHHRLGDRQLRRQDRKLQGKEGL